MWGTKRRIQCFKVEKTMKIFRNHENASRRHGRSRDSGREGFGPYSVFQRQENLHIVPSKTTEPSTRWCVIFVTIISSSWKWNVVQLSKLAFYQLTFHRVDDLHILEDQTIHILSLLFHRPPRLLQRFVRFLWSMSTDIWENKLESDSTLLHSILV